MNILIATGDFLPNVGGVAAVVLGLSNGLDARGHNVWILHCDCRAAAPTAGLEQDYGGAIGGRIKVVPFRLQPVRAPWRKLSFASRAGSVVRKLDAQIGFDVIHWHTLYPDGLAAIPYRGTARKVFTNHTSGFLESLASPWRRIELRYLLSRFDHILAPSQELADASRSVGAPSVSYVPNGVDTARFRPGSISRQAARAQLGLRETDFAIVLARRFEVKNGLRYFAGAFNRICEQIPNAIAIFCGPDYDGIEFPATRAALTNANAQGRVRFVGSVPNSEMPLYYSAADVSVVPSLIEATSITALESMASGVPVVATSVGGLPELIRPGKTGLLVPPMDPEALAEATITLFTNPSLRASLAAAGRQAVLESFAWERIAAATEAEYMGISNIVGAAGAGEAVPVRNPDRRA